MCFHLLNLLFIYWHHSSFNLGVAAAGNVNLIVVAVWCMRVLIVCLSLIQSDQ